MTTPKFNKVSDIPSSVFFDLLRGRTLKNGILSQLLLPIPIVTGNAPRSMMKSITTVQVWLPSLKMPTKTFPSSADAVQSKALSAIENVGHAALSLSEGTYISWWPDETVSPQSGYQSPSFQVHSYEQDCQSEGSKPSVSAKISGLHEDIMRSWWERVADNGFAIPFTFENNPKTNRFDLWSTNCSNIVAIVLRLGGCEKILALPRFDMQTPLHIALWAKTAEMIQAAQVTVRSFGW